MCVCRYSAFLFSNEAEAIIRANRAAPTKLPLFMYLAYQSVHAPAQAPQSYIDLFNTSLPGKEFAQRRTFAGMVCRRRRRRRRRRCALNDKLC